MKTITLKISDEEYKAMEHIVPSVEEWIDHALNNKVRQCVDRIIEKHTDRQAKKVPMIEKLALIKNLELKTRKEQDKENDLIGKDAEIDKIVLKTAKERQREFELDMEK